MLRLRADLLPQIVSIAVANLRRAVVNDRYIIAGRIVGGLDGDA
jgi:hypothetical protein